MIMRAPIIPLILGEIEENEFKEAMKKWFVRMKRCIEVTGGYFEQLR